MVEVSIEWLQETLYDCTEKAAIHFTRCSKCSGPFNCQDQEYVDWCEEGRYLNYQVSLVKRVPLKPGTIGYEIQEVYRNQVERALIKEMTLFRRFAAGPLSEGKKSVVFPIVRRKP